MRKLYTIIILCLLGALNIYAQNITIDDIFRNFEKKNKANTTLAEVFEQIKNNKEFRVFWSIPSECEGIKGNVTCIFSPGSNTRPFVLEKLRSLPSNLLYKKCTDERQIDYRFYIENNNTDNATMLYVSLGTLKHDRMEIVVTLFTGLKDYTSIVNKIMTKRKMF